MVWNRIAKYEQNDKDNSWPTGIHVINYFSNANSQSLSKLPLDIDRTFGKN